MRANLGRRTLAKRGGPDVNLANCAHYASYFYRDIFFVLALTWFMKKSIISILLILTSFICLNLYAEDYIYSGDGKIRVSGKTIVYRSGDKYLEAGIKKLNKLYGTDYSKPELSMSVRLIELLDFLEDRFAGKNISITSGYRSPQYNQGLRNKGKLAASSSLHIDAEAIDIVMKGVSSAKLYEHIRSLDRFGVGYYHGKTIHIDTGPSRFWDETSSKTETKEAPENRHIAVKTYKDIYNMGANAHIKFSRVNEYPIGISKNTEIICKKNGEYHKYNTQIVAKSSVKQSQKGCLNIKNRQEGRSLSIKTPKKLKKSANCKIKIDFCAHKTEKMPNFIYSNQFFIR